MGKLSVLNTLMTAEKERNKAGWKTWEVAKAGCTRQKVLVWRPYAPTAAMRDDIDDDDHDCTIVFLCLLEQ